jgi:hypothetical protein
MTAYASRRTSRGEKDNGVTTKLNVSLQSFPLIGCKSRVGRIESQWFVNIQIDGKANSSSSHGIIFLDRAVLLKELTPIG